MCLLQEFILYRLSVSYIILHHDQLYLPNINLSAFRKGSMFSAIKLFNRLPKIIQSIKEDRTSFRKELTSYLMNNAFYTVSEYLECNLNN
jgi:hypothetical protein